MKKKPAKRKESGQARAIKALVRAVLKLTKAQQETTKMIAEWRKDSR